MTMRFIEIAFIKVKTKGSAQIILKDTAGKKLTMGFHFEFVPLLDEILEKAADCKKVDIDFDYLIKRCCYQNIELVRDKYFEKLK